MNVQSNPFYGGAPTPTQNQNYAGYGVGYPQQQVPQAPANYFQNGNFQAPQQPVRSTNSISGRIVGNLNEIAPNEVPMDGRVSYFPTSDYERIYARAWMSDGTIKTVTYTRVLEEGEQPAESNPMDVILARLDNIEKMLSKRNNFRPNKQYPKKDNGANEVKKDD